MSETNAVMIPRVRRRVDVFNSSFTICMFWIELLMISGKSISSMVQIKITQNIQIVA